MPMTHSAHLTIFPSSSPPLDLPPSIDLGASSRRVYKFLKSLSRLEWLQSEEAYRRSYGQRCWSILRDGVRRCASGDYLGTPGTNTPRRICAFLHHKSHLLWSNENRNSLAFVLCLLPVFKALPVWRRVCDRRCECEVIFYLIMTFFFLWSSGGKPLITVVK